MIALVVYALALAELDLAIAWDYKANGGDWSGYGSCGQPGQQSPIDLPASAPIAEEDLTMFLKYPELKSAVTVYNNGNSIALTMPEVGDHGSPWRAGFGLGKGSDGPKVFESDGADAYRLWQVNFHSPSEHTINGERLPLEMQMMHQQVTGGDGLAVVVVLFNNAANAHSAFLDSIIGDGLPQSKLGSANQQFPEGSFLAEASRKPSFEFAPVLGGSEFYTYEGSLTVPPCEKQVKYFVRKDPVSVAHAQLEAFSKVLKETCAPNGNYRATQTLSSAVQLLASVDLIKAPDKVVRPGKARLPEEKAAHNNGIIDPRCKPVDLQKNLDRFTVGDSAEVRAAKTKLNAAVMDFEVTDALVASGGRNVANLQKLYDASSTDSRTADGPVERMHLKWQVLAAKQLLVANTNHVPLKNVTRNKQFQVTMDLMLSECIAQHSTPSAKANGWPNNALHLRKQKATRHFNYPEPNVRLPSGLGGSPFSAFSDVEDARKVTNIPKIKANLRQPDCQGVEVDDTLEAHTFDGMASRDGVSQETLVMRLPLNYASVDFYASAFKGDLVKAMAKISGVSENRLEIKETRKVEVQQVHISKHLEASTEAPGPYDGPLTQTLWHGHSSTTVPVPVPVAVAVPVPVPVPWGFVPVPVAVPVPVPLAVAVPVPVAVAVPWHYHVTTTPRHIHVPVPVAVAVLLSRSKGVEGHDKEVVLPRRALRQGHLRSH